MITWLWLSGVLALLAALFAAGMTCLTRRMHRQGASWAGIIAYQQMKRRPRPSP